MCARTPTCPHTYNLCVYPVKTITDTRVSTLAMMATTTTTPSTTQCHKLEQVIVHTNTFFIRQKGNVC